MNRSDFVPASRVLVGSKTNGNRSASASPGRPELGMSSPHTSEPTALPESPTEFPLVGLASEIQRLKLHLAVAEPSGPEALLVRGVTGVGKTRLIRVAKEAALHAGMKVFHGCAFPLDNGLSYAVLADAFVPFLQEAEPHTLQTLTRGRLAELYSLFPAAADGGELPDISVAGPPEDKRTTLFWSFSELLRGLVRREPLLVVAEDLHWADPSAIQLLHFAIRQLEGHPVRFLCSSTEGLREENSALLDFETSLSGAGLAQSLAVDPLEEDEIQQLVMKTFSVSIDVCRDFATRLHEWSGGNSLFATETLRSLIESGHLYPRNETWLGWEIDEFEPPRGVQDLVASRLSRLSQPAQRVVEVASAMGDRIRFSILASVAGLRDEETLDAIDELRVRGIVEGGAADSTGSLAFTHPLIRECVYSRLGGPRTRMLHREVGDALEKEGPERVIDRAEELAYHFHCSGDHTPAGKAFQYLLVAGRRALDRHADQEAARHLGAALELMDRRKAEEAAGPEPSGVLTDFAKALERTGQYDEAIEVLKRGLRDIDDPEGGSNIAELRRRLGVACFRNGQYTEALAHYEAGILAADSHPLLKGQIQLARGACLQELARWDEAADDVNAALALAQQHDHSLIGIRAHQLLALHNMWTGRPTTARQHAWKAIEGAEASQDLSGAWGTHWGLGVLEGLTGNLAQMKERITEARRLAEELRSPILELRTDELSLQEAHARGDWDTAVMMGEQAISRARALGQRSLLPRLLVWTALPVLGRGDITRGRALVEEAWALAGLDAPGEPDPGFDLHAAIPAFTGKVSLHLAEGDIASAITVGEQGLEMADRSGSAIWSLHHLRPLLSEAYLLARDLEGAQRVGLRLRRDSKRMDHILGLAWADACDALVTWLSGDVEGGSVRLRAAADRLEGIPMGVRRSSHTSATSGTSGRVGLYRRGPFRAPKGTFYLP